MATPTARLGLSVPDGSDSADGPLSFAQIAGILDDAALIDRGNLASRPVSTAPSPGIVGRLYVVSDEGNRLDLDYGTGWITIGTGLGFAPIDDPVFTGVPEAPTPAPGTDDEQIATTEFVQFAFGNTSQLRSSYVAAEEAITSAGFAVAPTADAVTFTPPPGSYFWVYAGGGVINPASAFQLALFMNGTQVQVQAVGAASASYRSFYFEQEDGAMVVVSEAGTTPTDATPGRLVFIGQGGVLFKAGANPDPVTFDLRYKRTSGSDVRVKERHLLVQVATV